MLANDAKMQNAQQDNGDDRPKIDKVNADIGNHSSTPQSTSNSSPTKSETETYSEHRRYMSETSESEEDSVSEVESFVIGQEFEDDAQAEAAKFLLGPDDDRAVDPDTQARLEALLQAAGIGQLAAKDGKHLGDPEVLRRLTSSVSCALDEAAAALTRMRSDGAQRPAPTPAAGAAAGAGAAATPERAADSLVEACTDGDVGTVRKLLTEGRSVHETSEEGESLLSLACSAGYFELAQVLLAMHANVEDRGMKGECTPLMEAASAGHLDIVRLLVAHGADVNAQSTSGNTPLMYGCAGGHTDVVRFLLENGANVEDHNENGHTPLMEAASAGHVALARVLLAHGAGINTHSNEFKESALTLACYKGHLDMVRFLLEAGADQEHKTDEMHTALMEASMDGHVEVARLLLDSGAQVNMPTDSFESPLTLAACGGHVDLAMLLIERGANIEEVNDEGYTPLMEAAREGHEEMVHLLLGQGANINAQTDETQETALTLACCGGFTEVADILLKGGADIELGASTPLMEAAQEGHLELVRFLLESGANVHATTQTGDTALTYACENGHTDVADLLLQYGADLEHESEGGRTPLMKACRAGHYCTVQFLITKGANVRRQTSNNDHTPLSLACAGGHLQVVELLLSHNADPNHKLKDNSTMLIEAAKGGHVNVVQLLLDYPHSMQPMALGGQGGATSLAVLPGGQGAAGRESPTPPPQAAGFFQQPSEVVLQEVPVPVRIVQQDDPNASQSEPEPVPKAGRKSALPKSRSAAAVFDGNLTSAEAQQVRTQPLNDFEEEVFSASAAMEFLNKEDPNGTLIDFIRNRGKSKSVGPADEAAAGVQPKAQILDELHRVERELHGKPPVPAQHVFQYLPREGCGQGGSPMPHMLNVDIAVQQQKQQGLGLFPANAPPALQAHGAFYAGATGAPACLQSPPLKLAVGDGTVQPTPAFYFAPTGGGSGGGPVPANPQPSPGTIAQAPTGVVGQPVKFQSVVAHAEVSPNTAISDRPKAKPISKKDGKNVRKQQAQPQAFQPNLYATPQQQQQLFAQQFIQKTDANQEVLNMQALAESLTQIQNEEMLKKEEEKKKKKVNNAAVLQYQESLKRVQPAGSPQKAQLEVYDPGQDDKKDEIDDELKDEDYTSVEEVVETLEAFNPVEVGDPQVYPTTLDESVMAQLAVQQAEAAAAAVDGPRVEYFAVPTSAAPPGGQQAQVPVPAPFSYEYLAAAAAAGMPKDHQMYQAGFQAGYSHSLMQQQMACPNPSAADTLTTATIVPTPNTAQPFIQQPQQAQAACGHAVQAQQQQQQQQQPPAQNQANVHHCQPCAQHQPSMLQQAQQVQAATQTGQNADKKLAKVADGIKFKKGRVLRHQNQAQNGFQQSYQIDHNSAITQYSGAAGNQQCPAAAAAAAVVTSPCMDVDSETESNHDTALTLACAGGHEELVELLISRGADIEHRDKKGFTPLILAATAGHEKVVEILLNHNADIEAQSERTKDTPLSLACSGGRYEVVELLLNRNANKEHRNVSDYTPLSLAASGGYVNIIKLLLSHGAEINSRTGSKLGISPLMLAAMNGHTAAVKLLLDMGSDINAQIETNRNTALTLACFQGRHEVVSLLLDRKANVEHRAKTGLTPLMEAASGGYVDVGRVLLDKGADVNATPVPSSRDTALTIAADKGHVRFVELLLCRAAQVEVKNKKGNSPLWLAANGGHLPVVELLYNLNADIDSQDNRKVSCLMAAFRKGHVKVVKWMVHHVTQFPSDQEMMRYIATISDKELLEKCHECVKLIRAAKETQAAKANKNASILLEELESEKTREESKRLAAARRRERKKKKKLEKKEERRKLMEENKKNENYDDDGKEKKQVEDEKNEEEDTVPEVNPANRNVNDANDKEEGDSGIDANSQGSCSSNDIKPKEKRKNKKTKKVTNAQMAKKEEAANRNKAGSSKDKTVDETPEKDKDAKSSPPKTSPNAGAARKSYENTKSPADRDDFEATGNENYVPSKPAKQQHKHDETVPSPPQPSKSATNTSPKQSTAKRDEGWKEVVRKSSVQTVGESGVRKVSVPLNAISRVIGRQGSNINAIRASTGAHIEVEKQSKGQGERIITIKGSSDATKQAHQLIAALIKDPDVDIMSMLPKASKASTAATTLWDKTQIGTKKSAGKVVVVSQAATASAHPKAVVQTSAAASAGRFTSTAATKFRGATPTVTSRSSVLRINEKSSQNVRPAAPPRSVPAKTIVVSSSVTTSSGGQTFAAKLTENQPPASVQLSVNVIHSTVVTKPRTTTTLGVPHGNAGPVSPQAHNVVIPQNSPNKNVRPAPTSSAPPIVQHFQNKPTTSAPFAGLNHQNNTTVMSSASETVVTTATVNRSVTPTVLPAVSSNMPPSPAEEQLHISQAQPALQTASEYTLFYSGDHWARKEQEQQKINFAAVTGNANQSSSAQYKFIDQEPQVDVSKAPGYRGGAVCSPVSSKTSSNSTTPPNISNSSYQPYVDSKQMGLPPIGQNLPHRPAVPSSQPADFMAGLMDFKPPSTMLGYNDNAHLLQSTFGFPPSRLNPKAPEYPNYGKPPAFNGYQQQQQQQQQGQGVYQQMGKTGGMLDGYGRGGLASQSRFWMQLPQAELMSGLAGMTIHNLQASIHNAEGLENGGELGIVSGSPAMSPAALHAEGGGYGPQDAAERRPPQPIGSGRSRKAYEGGGWPGGDSAPQKWGMEYPGAPRQQQQQQAPVFADVDVDFGRQVPLDHKYMNGPAAAAVYYHQPPMRADFMPDVPKLDLSGWDAGGQQRPATSMSDLQDKQHGWTNHWNK